MQNINISKIEIVRQKNIGMTSRFNHKLTKKFIRCHMRARSTYFWNNNINIVVQEGVCKEQYQTKWKQQHQRNNIKRTIYQNEIVRKAKKKVYYLKRMQSSPKNKWQWLGLSLDISEFFYCQTLQFYNSHSFGRSVQSTIHFLFVTLVLPLFPSLTHNFCVLSVCLLLLCQWNRLIFKMNVWLCIKISLKIMGQLCRFLCRI